MPASVICISRTDGAGGPEIGRLLAERVGFRYEDDAIIVRAAEAERLLPESVARAESRTVGRHLEVDFNRHEKTGKVRAMIRKAILEAADEGGVVIVAHAASFALADRENVLRVLVTASEEGRLRGIAESKGVGRKEAAKLLEDSDDARKAYLKRYYGISRELPTHYDLVINTERIAPEAAVEVIARAAS